MWRRIRGPGGSALGLLAIAAVFSGAVPGALHAGAVVVDPGQQAFFEEQVRPLLVQHCYECHAADTAQKGGLQLDSRAGWEKGGDSGPALIPGDPESSLLLRAVSYMDPDLQMPPEQRLPAAAIESLREWIAMGAPDPRDGVLLREDEGIDVAARKREHWAWQPVSHPAVPAPSDDAWSRTDVDRFLLQRLRDKGVEPSPDADRRVMLRRLTFDLTGLPPSPEAVEAFLRDESDGAYERAVESLLGSPRFGERWGQHWLDLMRYAETRGHEQDFPIPEAWRYRDYVIRAFNADVPYDDFLVEHIAGDLVERPRLDPATRMNESIQGTGFWHLGEATHSPVDIRGDEALRVANQIDVFSKAFLGLTVSCARCHDHKFDAITTEDYYALFGYLQSSSFHLADVADPIAQDKAVQELRRWKAEMEEELRVPLAESMEKGLDEAEQAAVAALRERSGIPMGQAESKEGLASVWREELERAAGEAGHPLRIAAIAAGFAAEGAITWPAAWDKARLQTEERQEESSRLRAPVKVVRTVEEGERNFVREELPFDLARDVIVDYSRLAPGDWIAAGLRFGEGPAQAGDWVLAEDPAWPLARIAVGATAEADLLSGKLRGMLRTKTFEVSSDRIWLRYAGEGRMFVAVDSHRVCEGPLHSQGLKKQLEPAGPGFRWVSHDLREYIGHRAHLEFTPGPGFALSQVLFAADEPVEVEEVGALDWNVGPCAGPEEAAQQVIEGWRRTLRTWGAGSPNETDLRELNWLLAHRNLFGSAESDRVLAESLASFAGKRRRIENGIPAPLLALTLIDGSPENEPVHVRGNHRNLAAENVPRRFLEALGGKADPAAGKGSGRMELARGLASPDNPLTARVLVNRLWHHLFGRGLVESVDNFGATGATPTHPELLDWLASDFMSNGWSVKHVIRRIVLSSAYRQSSRPDPAKERVDPANILVHRMAIRRLEGEAIRDTILTVSGRLDSSAGGPGVPVHIPEFMRTNRSPGHDGPLDGGGRRSVYLEARRNHPDTLLAAFDRPTPFTAIGKRNVSNSPAQPLILLNSPFVHEQARLWARRLLAAPNRTAVERVADGYAAAFGRAPEDWELQEAMVFLKDLGADGGAEEAEEGWTALCHTWFNVKEFYYVN